MEQVSQGKSCSSVVSSVLHNESRHPVKASPHILIRTQPLQILMQLPSQSSQDGLLTLRSSTISGEIADWQAAPLLQNVLAGLTSLQASLCDDMQSASKYTHHSSNQHAHCRLLAFSHCLATSVWGPADHQECESRSHLSPLLQRLLLQGCQFCQQQLQAWAIELPSVGQVAPHLGQQLLVQAEN